jgi:hypothetical protein
MEQKNVSVLFGESKSEIIQIINFSVLFITLTFGGFFRSYK